MALYCRTGQGLRPTGETTHYDLCVAGAPANHVRCASLRSRGKGRGRRTAAWRLGSRIEDRDRGPPAAAGGGRPLGNKGAFMIKPSQPPWRAMGKQANRPCGRWKCGPPLVAGATTFTQRESCHWILRSLLLPYSTAITDSQYFARHCVPSKYVRWCDSCFFATPLSSVGRPKGKRLYFSRVPLRGTPRSGKGCTMLQAKKTLYAVLTANRQPSR